jgi:hypothetical protein
MYINSIFATLARYILRSFLVRDHKHGDFFLKKMDTVAIDSEVIVSNEVPSIKSDNHEFYVDKILDEKTLKNKLKLYRVRWQGEGEEGDTWEPETNLISGDGTVNAALLAYWDLQRTNSIGSTDEEVDDNRSTDKDYEPKTTTLACGKCNICSQRKKYGGPGLPRDQSNRPCSVAYKMYYQRKPKKLTKTEPKKRKADELAVTADKALSEEFNSLKDRVTRVEEEVNKWTKYDDSVLSKAISDMAARSLNDSASYQLAFNNINMKLAAIQRDMLEFDKKEPDSSTHPPQQTTDNKGSYEQLVRKMKNDITENIMKTLRAQITKDLNTLRSDIAKDTKAMYVDLLLKK